MRLKRLRVTQFACWLLLDINPAANGQRDRRFALWSEDRAGVFIGGYFETTLSHNEFRENQ